MLSNSSLYLITKLINNFSPLITVITPLFLLSQNPNQDKFNTLKKTLENYNFTVKIAPPPQTSTYGLLQVKTRTIFINPIVFDLNIALPTLIHEATHAAQLCAGKGEITSLNLSISPPNIARPYFTHYNHGLRRHLEAEAYAIQTHPEGYGMILSLLNEYCA